MTDINSEELLENFEGNTGQVASLVKIIKEQILQELVEREKSMILEKKLEGSETIIDQIKSNPHILAELYDSMRVVLRPWAEQRTENGMATIGYARQNVFGDTIVFLKKEFPKWKIQVPHESPDEVRKLVSSLDLIFTKVHAERSVKIAVDKYLESKGYLIMNEEAVEESSE